MPTPFNAAAYRNPPRFAPSDRLKAILNQPGREVRVLDALRVVVKTEDEAADREFHQHVPHAAAIVGRPIAVTGAVGLGDYVLQLGEVAP